MKPETHVIIGALEQLAKDIQTDDGVANAALWQAAERMRELSKQLEEEKAKTSSNREPDHPSLNPSRPVDRHMEGNDINREYMYELHIDDKSRNIIIGDLREKCKEAFIALSENGFSRECCLWPDHVKDLILLSERHPKFDIILLTYDGKRAGVTHKHFKNGKLQECFFDSHGCIFFSPTR